MQHMDSLPTTQHTYAQSMLVEARSDMAAAGAAPARGKTVRPERGGGVSARPEKGSEEARQKPRHSLLWPCQSKPPEKDDATVTILPTPARCGGPARGRCQYDVGVLLGDLKPPTQQCRGRHAPDAAFEVHDDKLARPPCVKFWQMGVRVAIGC